MSQKKSVEENLSTFHFLLFFFLSFTIEFSRVLNILDSKSSLLSVNARELAQGLNVGSSMLCFRWVVENKFSVFRSSFVRSSFHFFPHFISRSLLASLHILPFFILILFPMWFHSIAYRRDGMDGYNFNISATCSLSLFHLHRHHHQHHVVENLKFFNVFSISFLSHCALLVENFPSTKFSWKILLFFILLYEFLFLNCCIAEIFFTCSLLTWWCDYFYPKKTSHSKNMRVTWSVPSQNNTENNVCFPFSAIFG